MILLRNVKLYPDESEDLLEDKAAKLLHLKKGEIKSLRINKKSLDARKKNDIHYRYALALETDNEKRLLQKFGGKDLCAFSEPDFDIPRLSSETRPVIAGFGPAGMFAALVLSRAGLRPVVLERGCEAAVRKAKVDAFRAGGALDPECNVQFGEGGAGTFSDGKLNTGIKSPRISFVLRTFYEHGAPERILYDAKPHIGTDILINVVQSMRREIISLGGEVRFNSRLSGLGIEKGRLRSVTVSSKDGEYTLPCDRLILAIGHSARDSFEMLLSAGVPMEPKPFSMGVRIEHRQKTVDRAQYGETALPLPPADYSLSEHFPDGSSAYTFCMCPGGEVIAAASEEGGVVTNGMSLSARDGENANSALLVTLHPEDFPDGSVLGGMYWQRSIEQRAFAMSGSYLAPAQLIGDFLARRKSTGAGSVTPSYRPGVHWCELHDLFPEKLTDVLENAIPALGKRLSGFDDPDAVLTAPETRSSSPVRILRGEDRSSEISGLYPCGEGAGYAGGITSAAVDGIRCAESVMDSLSQK